METLIIPATEITPYIYFNPETPVNGKYLFEIAGESRPEDARRFYTPVYTWIEEFKEDSKYWGVIGRTIRIKFKLSYFNSSSAKCFLDIIERIDKLHKTYPQTDFKIIWTYDEFDEDMKQAGEEFSKLVAVPFHIVQNYLYIEPTKNTPKIVVNTEKKFLEISGKSFGENLEKVYQPLFEWIDRYGHQYFKSDFLINLKVEYFNTPSVRIMRDILKKLYKIFQLGNNFSVNFYYSNEGDLEDADMLFKGIPLPHKLVKIESEIR